jgi:hypothetical protein
MDDLCIVTVSNRTAGPPTRGCRCSSTPAELAAFDLAAVSEAAKIEPEQLTGHARDPHIVAARWAWWSLLHERGMNRYTISRLVGRDHSSVGYAIKSAPKNKRTQAILAAVRSA